MENFLSGILEAEAVSARMIEDARASALLMVAGAKDEASRLKEDQQKYLIKECEALILRAEAEAWDVKYSAAQDASRDAGDMMRAGLERLEAVAEKFLGRMLGR
ncbi:MAG: hypothetical protein WCI27_03660 [Candidatus Omnitrophota bacterium]